MLINLFMDCLIMDFLSNFNIFFQKYMETFLFSLEFVSLRFNRVHKKKIKKRKTTNVSF